MYRGFNLKISLDDFDILGRSLLVEKGKNANNSLNTEMNLILSDLTKDGIIDGTELSDVWFKTIKTDVFISHSHNDTELAYVFSGWLQENFELNVFLDKNVWGSADKLLKAIDNIYSKSDDSHNDGGYDYNKRNYSTSHVHAMLATALMKVMDNSEVVIFLNTPESIPTIKQTMEEQDEYTLSPWIYEELVMTTVLRERPWSEYRKELFFEHSARESASLQIKYKAPTEMLTPIDSDNMETWRKEYVDAQKRRAEIYSGLFEKDYDHPLNYLYRVIFGTG